MVLIPGHNCLTFKTEDELINIIKDTSYLLKQGSVIGENLRNEYKSFWGIHCIKERLYKTISTNTIKFNPIIETRRKINSVSTFASRLNIYENLLELHRCHENINLFIIGPEADVFINDAIDLPRIIFTNQDQLFANSINPKILIQTYEQSTAEIFHVV